MSLTKDVLCWAEWEWEEDKVRYDSAESTVGTNAIDKWQSLRCDGCNRSVCAHPPCWILWSVELYSRIVFRKCSRRKVTIGGRNWCLPAFVETHVKLVLIQSLRYCCIQLIAISERVIPSRTAVYACNGRIAYSIIFLSTSRARCLSVRKHACQSDHLRIYLSIYLSLYVYIYISVLPTITSSLTWFLDC